MIAVLGISVAGLVSVWRWQSREPLPASGQGSLASTSAAPGRLSSPAGFVGREVCGECHQENFQLHAASGHASTLASTADSTIADFFAGKTVDAGPGYGQFRYDVDEQGLWVHRVGEPQDGRFPLQYVLGSGHNAKTMFTIVEDGKGGSVGVEHRISWFASHQDFGLTPDHADKVPTASLETFGNPIRGEMMHGCIGCHSTHGKISAGKVLDLVPNVNCEKCHGPGAEHVRQARLTKTPPPFSVGRSDWDQESELQLCGSCHRLPINFSPKQLREYPAALIRFQPVGMLRSPCYLESDGAMKCTTCHNPHQSSVAKSKADYVADCTACHQADTEHRTVCPVSPTDGCIECHMPAMKFEQGMIFHDHWIRVRDDS